jgi:hypothetical protein
MKRYFFTAIIAAFLLFLVSCDLLRNGMFEVVSWSPGGGFHNPHSIMISLSFSLEPERLNVERAFSLTENGKSVSGRFAWDSSTLYFFPSVPFQENKNYLISLGTGAQDKKGLSLERRFEVFFTTRPESSRPVLLETFPADGGIIGGMETIRLVFSQALQRSSLQNALSLSPQLSGVWGLEDGGFCAVFTPSTAWVHQKNYRLVIDAALISERGLGLGKTETLHFSSGEDICPPSLLAAYARNDSIRVFQLETDGRGGNENTGWERQYTLELVFSEPVDRASLASALSVEPSPGISAVSPPGFSCVHIFKFNTEPVWGISYIIRLNNSVKDEAGNESAEKTVFRIKVSGPLSKPPSLKGVRMPLDPSAHTDGQTLTFTQETPFNYLPLDESVFPFYVETPFWVELYFDTADPENSMTDPSRAVIDAFSLMSKFKFTATNSAVSFSPREIRISNFSVSQAAAGMEQTSRIEIRGMIENHPYGGMIVIETGAGLEDSFGNKTTEAFRILLLK